MKSLKNNCWFWLFCLILLGFIVNFANRHKQIDLSEPIEKKYQSDELMYLKTYYLMKQDNNYYSAFRSANENIAEGRLMTKDIFTWRLPTIFYFWKLFAPQAQFIIYWYWFFGFISLICSYYLLHKFLPFKYSILGPILLLPYLGGVLNYPTSFLFTEWWAVFFFIIGLTLLIYKKNLPAWWWLFLTICTRELMIIPILFFLIYSLLKRTNRLFFLSLVIMFIAVYLLHEQSITKLIPAISNLETFNSFSGRIHGFNKEIFLKMISFSMYKYPLVEFKSHFGLIILAFISSLKLVINKLNNVNINFLLLAGWGMAGIFPFINSSRYNDYWGILFMPLILLIIPLLFLNKNKF